MKLTSTSFSNGQAIPGDFSFCTPDPAHHVCLGKNLNPHLAWSEAPADTKSFVLICHDPDVPSKGDDVNQEGRTVPAALPRVDFFHWVLIDLPASFNTIAEGEFSHQVTPRGKPGAQVAQGCRQGINNYTDWFAGDHDMTATTTALPLPAVERRDHSSLHLHCVCWILKKLPIDGKFGGRKSIAAIQGPF
jgi:hypothetical protein